MVTSHPIVTVMAHDPHASSLLTSANARRASLPVVLSCDSCEVTWRDVFDAPCWFCGEPGTEANPERLVLD